MSSENRPKLIIVVGARGVGKTTVTNWLREKLLYTNMHRLTGCGDRSIVGKDKMKHVYINTLDYIESMSVIGMNMIYDGFFMSEYVFASLGYKDYDFKDCAQEFAIRLDKIADYLDTHVIVLKLTDKTIYDERLARDKSGYLGANDCIAESIRQEEAYIKCAEDMSVFTENIQYHCIATDTIGWWKGELSEILGMS